MRTLTALPCRVVGLGASLCTPPPSRWLYVGWDCLHRSLAVRCAGLLRSAVCAAPSSATLAGGWADTGT